MTLAQLHTFFKESLSEQYPREEVQSFFELLAAHYLHFNRAQLILEKEALILAELLQIFKAAIDRLNNQEPIQYIIGQTEFYGLPLKVTPDTLIPRPETEELVDWIVNDTDSSDPIKVLDLCTGSGCIAIALAHAMPHASVSALDISEGALKVARDNALQVSVAVNFTSADVLKGIPFDEKFDVIVSNPPYVRELEKAKMAANVLDHEPSQALFVPDNDPLVFYRAIATFAQTHLTRTGALYLEINEYLSKETKLLLADLGFEQIEVKTDLFGKKRMIKCG
ncbi:MAG: peptide chain release factor N(5)-glutamine methyltransferase [Gilvibacter sp.]